MDDRTVRALKALNRRFYQRHAAAFSTTRETPWRGWERLLPHLAEAVAPSPGSRILDAGCGNGRFLRWLADQGTHPFVGVAADRSLPLLQAARAAGPQTAVAMDLASLKGELPLRPGACRAVIAMGVLHHIPAHHLRRKFVREIVELLSDRGVLVLTAWQFADRSRFQARVRPWSLAEGVTEAELDPGDHLLQWGAGPSSEAEPPISDDGLSLLSPHHG